MSTQCPPSCPQNDLIFYAIRPTFLRNTSYLPQDPLTQYVLSTYAIRPMFYFFQGGHFADSPRYVHPHVRDMSTQCPHNSTCSISNRNKSKNRANKREKKVLSATCPPNVHPYVRNVSTPCPPLSPIPSPTPTAKKRKKNWDKKKVPASDRFPNHPPPTPTWFRKQQSFDKIQK